MDVSDYIKQLSIRLKTTCSLIAPGEFHIKSLRVDKIYDWTNNYCISLQKYKKLNQFIFI